MTAPAHRRILLKLSGEALMGDRIDQPALVTILEQLGRLGH